MTGEPQCPKTLVPKSKILKIHGHGHHSAKWQSARRTTDRKRKRAKESKIDKINRHFKTEHEGMK